MSQVELSFDNLIDGYDNNNGLNPLNNLLDSDLPNACFNDSNPSLETTSASIITTSGLTNFGFSSDKNDTEFHENVEEKHAGTSNDSKSHPTEYLREGKDAYDRENSAGNLSQERSSRGIRSDRVADESASYAGMLNTNREPLASKMENHSPGNMRDACGANENSHGVFSSTANQRNYTQANKRGRTSDESSIGVTQYPIEAKSFTTVSSDHNAPKRPKSCEYDGLRFMEDYFKPAKTNQAGIAARGDRTQPHSPFTGDNQKLINNSNFLIKELSTSPALKSHDSASNIGFVNRNMPIAPRTSSPQNVNQRQSSKGISRSLGHMGQRTSNRSPVPSYVSPMSSSGISSHREVFTRNNDVITTTLLGSESAMMHQNDGFGLNLDEQFGAHALPFHDLTQMGLGSKPSHMLQNTATPKPDNILSSSGAPDLEKTSSNFGRSHVASFPLSSATTRNPPQIRISAYHRSQSPINPNFSQPLSNTGNPNLLSGNTFQRVHGAHEASQDYMLFGTSVPTSRNQNSGMDLVETEGIPWEPVHDPVKTQEAHTIPHIVIDSDLSPSGIDALSPVSSTGTGYSSYRSTGSPNTTQQVTRASTANALCEVLNPKKEYDKIQKKFLQGPRRSEQRIQRGIVKFKIQTKIPLVDGTPLRVFVKREPKAAEKLCKAHPDEYTMEEIDIPDVRISPSNEPTDSSYLFCYRCELDLDSIYLTEDGKEVYKLARSKGSVNNLFQLWFVLFFNNNFNETLMPYEFVLKSGRTPSQQDYYSEGGTRETIGPKYNLSCRHLEAETAKITNIHCQSIETKNHDIAYFMRVRCEDEEKPPDLEKGDVVAFLEDDEGYTYIDFLTSDNAKNARLAGVISRTAFFKGRKAICDPDHADSDLVCIIGEVDVKVHGKVGAGDLIYTSNYLLRRGTAVARNPRDPEIQPSDPDGPKPTLLGMAMESHSEEDIKLVSCLVSIVLGISDLHQRQTLEELRICNDKIIKMQRYLKGIWKKALVFLLFFLVAGTLCYVFLAPNSPYLIMKCEEGCKKDDKGSCLYLKYDYYPHESQEIDEIVGIRFEWRKIKKKLNLHFQRCTNSTDLRYYLNKNRCVTGNIRAISSWLDTTPQVPRVNVLAVGNCSDIFYHSVREGWVSYDRDHFDIHDCA